MWSPFFFTFCITNYRTYYWIMWSYLYHMFFLDNTISKIIFAFIFWDFIFWYMTWDNSISTKLFSWKKMWWANIVCGLQICLVWCTNMSLWWTRRTRQKYIRIDIWKIKLVQRIFVVTPYTAHIQCTIFLVFNSWMTLV